LTGWPWLSNIPILKYFFSSTHTEKQQNEIVFALTPHIVRGQELSSLNLKPLEVGTSTTIQLPRYSAPATPPVAPAAGKAPVNPGVTTPAAIPGATPAGPGASAPGAVLTAPPAGPGSGAPGATPATLASAAPAPSIPPRPAGPGSGVMLAFNPSQVTTSVGKTFDVDVVVSGAQNLFMVPVQLQYDAAKLRLMNVSNGSFLSQGQQPVALAHREDETTGTMQVTLNRPPNTGGVSGDGSVFTLTFMAKAEGQAAVAITRAGLRDANNQSVNATGTQGVVEIKPSTPPAPKQ